MLQNLALFEIQIFVFGIEQNSKSWIFENLGFLKSLFSNIVLKES